MAEKLMYKQKLRAGADYGPDHEAEPDPATGKLPLKLSKKGDVVWSERDLVKEEPGRYEAVGPPRAREPVAVKAAGAKAKVTVPAPAEEGQSHNRLTADAPPPANPATFTREELESAHKDELLDIAKEAGVKATARMSKEDLVAAILSGPQDDGE